MYGLKPYPSEWSARIPFLWERLMHGLRYVPFSAGLIHKQGSLELLFVGSFKAISYCCFKYRKVYIF
jgi:hypothetical protein